MLEGKRGLEEEEGDGIGRGKDICVVGLQGVESVARIACFCLKRQDSDKLSSPCSHLSPPPPPHSIPVHTHTHTHHTHCTNGHHAQFTTKMNGLPQCDTSQLHGGDGPCSPTKDCGIMEGGHSLRQNAKLF